MQWGVVPYTSNFFLCVVGFGCFVGWFQFGVVLFGVVLFVLPSFLFFPNDGIISSCH